MGTLLLHLVSAAAGDAKGFVLARRVFCLANHPRSTRQGCCHGRLWDMVGGSGETGSKAGGEARGVASRLA